MASAFIFWATGQLSLFAVLDAFSVLTPCDGQRAGFSFLFCRPCLHADCFFGYEEAF